MTKTVNNNAGGGNDDGRNVKNQIWHMIIEANDI